MCGSAPRSTRHSAFVLATQHSSRLSTQHSALGTEHSMAYRLTIKEMAPDERPREKLRLRGAASLSNGELLAILLNTGLPGEPVTEVAQRLLRDHGGLPGLMKLDAIELARIHGVGEAKAAKLKAALELAIRLAAMAPEQRP